MICDWDPERLPLHRVLGGLVEGPQGDANGTARCGRTGVVRGAHCDLNKNMNDDVVKRKVDMFVDFPEITL